MFREIEKLIMDAARLEDAVRVSQENWDGHLRSHVIHLKQENDQREQRTYPDVVPISRIPHCVNVHLFACESMLTFCFAFQSYDNRPLMSDVSGQAASDSIIAGKRPST